MNKQLKIIISGGGTGGHVFPAIAIADALKKRNPSAEILFVGALGRMEMEKVPEAGYTIVGLPVEGFQRRLTFKNVSFFYKLAVSIIKARKIVRSFKPHVAVGVGGYASGPVLRAAATMGIPTLIQEQNSFPGVTNKILATKARCICVAYPEMERFFPADRLVLTGNPIRKQLLNQVNREEAFAKLGLDGRKKTILVIGGSLGAASINRGIAAKLDNLNKAQNVQVLWQCGRYYYDELNQQIQKSNTKNIKLEPFISNMEYAYSVADVVISRAGAGTISELSLLGKASILVPSPNVAEDHQTKNAMSLVKEGAALRVPDNETSQRLVSEALALLNDENKRKQLEAKIKQFALPNAAEKIAIEVEKLVDFNKA